MADTYYISAYTGAQMDTADGRSLGPDATPTAGSDNLVASGGVFDAIQGAAPAIVETASGAVASFADGSASPVASLIAEIKAVQAGSGTPSPSNPRAISGFTGANINVSGSTVAISWLDEAGTVYGGTLNVTTGELTVTWGEVDLGDQSWTRTGTNPFFRADIADADTSFVTDTTEGYLCEEYGYAKITSGTTGEGICFAGNQCRIRDNNYATPAAFTTGVTGVKLIYKLATPQTYQLTPTEVDTLLGINNIWADTGDVTVEYRADTALFIAEKVPDAPTTDGTYTLTCTVSGGVATYSWA